MQENLSHEQLAIKPDTYSELFDLDKVVVDSDLVDSNYVL